MSDHTPFFPKNLEDYAPWVATRGLFAPYGECQCGCGKPAPVANCSRPKFGYVVGLPLRFVLGHHRTTPRDLENPNPSGLCMCGCGQTTPIATRTNLALKRVKGYPTRFAEGHRINPAGESVEERFWFYCVDNGPDQCWGWTGSRHQFGYGHFKCRGEVIMAHRFSYELHNGVIPEGEGYHGTCVLHKCDNPSCCNPEHLFLGSNPENVEDMVGKGRHAYGDKNGNAKLTNQDVIAIRDLRNKGWTLQRIADRYGISVRHTSHVARGLAWPRLESEVES